MIRNEGEYKDSVSRLVAERANLSQLEDRLKAAGLSGEDLELVMAPALTQLAQLEGEVHAFALMKKGDLSAYTTVGSLGRLLTAARIASNISQRELAARLGCHESQVSRDERNEYRGISLGRLNELINALDLEVTVRARVRSLARAAASPELATWAVASSRMVTTRDDTRPARDPAPRRESWVNQPLKTLGALPVSLSARHDDPHSHHPASAA
jgi:transcriptional regulator with XRE-family HTH domain